MSNPRRPHRQIVDQNGHPLSDSLDAYIESFMADWFEHHLEEALNKWWTEKIWREKQERIEDSADAPDRSERVIGKIYFSSFGGYIAGNRSYQWTFDIIRGKACWLEVD